MNNYNDYYNYINSGYNDMNFMTNPNSMINDMNYQTVFPNTPMKTGSNQIAETFQILRVLFVSFYIFPNELLLLSLQ